MKSQLCSSKFTQVLHATHDGVYPGSTDLQELFFDPAFIGLEEPRELNLSLFRVEPLDPVKDCNIPGFSIDIEGRVIAYSKVIGNNHKFKMAVVHTSSRTYYVVVRDRTWFYFYIPDQSVTLKEALYLLLRNNFKRGPKGYHRTCTIFKDVFYLLFGAVYKDPTHFQIPIWNGDGEIFTATVFYNPVDVNGNTITILGETHPWNMNMFPKKQLNKSILLANHIQRSLEDTSAIA